MIQKIIQRWNKIPSKQSLVFTARFNLVSDEDRQYISKMCNILNVKKLYVNEEINHTGEVRLIDSKQRILGFMDIDDARKRAQQLDLDLVLVNDKAVPAICKLLNYKEQVYKQFSEKILNKSYAGDQQKLNKMKIMKLSTKILIGDIQTKIMVAKDLAKKSKQLRVQIPVNSETMEHAQNLLYTFREQVKTHWVSQGELQSKNIEESDSSDIEFGTKKGEEEKKFKGQIVDLHGENESILYLEFRKVGESKSNDYDQQQINNIINGIQYQIMQNKSKSTVYAKIMRENQADLQQMAKIDQEYFQDGEYQTQTAQQVDDDDYDDDEDKRHVQNIIDSNKIGDMEEFYDYDDGDYEDEDMIKSNNDLHEWSQEYLKKKKFLKRMEMVMKMK